MTLQPSIHRQHGRHNDNHETSALGQVHQRWPDMYRARLHPVHQRDPGQVCRSRQEGPARVVWTRTPEISRLRQNHQF